MDVTAVGRELEVAGRQPPGWAWRVMLGKRVGSMMQGEGMYGLEE